MQGIHSKLVECDIVYCLLRRHSRNYIHLVHYVIIIVQGLCLCNGSFFTPFEFGIWTTLENSICRSFPGYYNIILVIVRLSDPQRISLWVKVIEFRAESRFFSEIYSFKFKSISLVHMRHLNPLAFFLRKIRGCVVVVIIAAVTIFTHGIQAINGRYSWPFLHLRQVSSKISHQNQRCVSFFEIAIYTEIH